MEQAAMRYARMRISVVASIALMPLMAAMPAVAQETREAIAAERRLARSREMQPTEPGRVERLFLGLSDERVLERLFDPPRGLFVRTGLPMPGAAPSAGLAWRASRPDRSYSFTASSALSVSREWIAEATLHARDLIPAVGDSRVFGGLSLSRSGRVINDFWGLGSSSADRDRTAYRGSQLSAA